MDISKKIRSLRKEKKLTLRELSRQSGVALATLSRIETGRMIGTIESHKSIAAVFGKALSQLYSDIEKDEKPIEHQSIKNRTDLFLHNDKASYYMLTNNILSKKMMPVMLKISSGGKTTPEQSRIETEKFIYVLKGEINLSIGTENHTLKKGETLYFNGSASHSLENTGKDEAQAICVTTPPAL
jgi:transcriptional regulator with XRE-family HTH domain